MRDPKPCPRCGYSDGLILVGGGTLSMDYFPWGYVYAVRCSHCEYTAPSGWLGADVKEAVASAWSRWGNRQEGPV